MSGITESGIVVKSYEEIVASLEGRFRQKFGEVFDTTEESPDGQNIRIMAKYIYDQWQLAEQAYHSYNPAVVGGNGLDNLVRLNGLERIENEPTKVGVHFDATTSIGETVAKGTIVTTESGDLEFTTNSDVIIPGEVLATCTTKGAIRVLAGEITKIKSDVADDITVMNFEQGVTGIVREGDPQLRARRERSLVRAGTATAEAIYAAVADLNLQFIAVLENDKDVTVNEIPPHSMMVVAEGSTLPLIAERVYNNKAIGITAHGDTIIEITDSEGYVQQIGVSRPRPKDIYVRCKVIRPANVAINRLRDIRNALVDHVNNLHIAETVEWSKMFSPATEAAPDVNIKSIEISENGATWITTDIPMGVIDRPVTTTAKVIVEELS
ncbi:hypothetical protein [Aeromonas phage PVN02]|nr:hypothetical protein [Aeromonas phage PVN02]QTQ06849.1 hypothetical protein [Aeromonas phage PVN04]CAC9972329.1 hypothetical protein PVN02_00062 [Aeromonas phage PVN02]